VALKSDGTVVAWGNNIYGQLNVLSLDGVTAIAAGLFHTLALKTMARWWRGETRPSIAVLPLERGNGHSLV